MANIPNYAAQVTNIEPPIDAPVKTVGPVVMEQQIVFGDFPSRNLGLESYYNMIQGTLGAGAKLTQDLVEMARKQKMLEAKLWREEQQAAQMGRFNFINQPGIGMNVASDSYGLLRSQTGLNLSQGTEAWLESLGVGGF